MTEESKGNNFPLNSYRSNSEQDGALKAIEVNTYNYTHDVPDNMTAINWNTQNELKSISKGNKPTYYQYSGGERVHKFTDKGSIKEERIYLGNFEIYRKFDNTSSLIIERQTVHVSDDTGRIAMLEVRTVGTDPSPEELTRYIYSNHLQSASLELDENAEIISYEEYHPYGTTSYQAMNASINATAKRYRYTGKERDEESGLYYHGARYYVPWLGRWTAVDPLENEYAGMSSYNYGFNNPVIFNDPSGMESEEQEQLGFDSGVGTSENPVQLATVKIVDNLDLPWYISFGFNEYGYYRNEYSEDGFSDPYNYVRFLDNAAGSIWNLGVDIFYSFKNFSFEGLKDEVLGYYDYYTQTGISQQWEDTKTSFIVMFSDIKTYENLVPLLLLKRPTTTVTAVSYEFKNITTVAAKGVTNGLSKTISAQKQARHIAGTAKPGGGFLNSVDDAQSVLNAVHSGKATFLGTSSQG